LVCADSQSPISADDFRFTASTTYPRALADFAADFAALEGVRCDVLITPHPDASGLWERVAKRDAGEPDALRDAQGRISSRPTVNRAITFIDTLHPPGESECVERKLAHRTCPDR